MGVQQVACGLDHTVIVTTHTFFSIRKLALRDPSAFQRIRKKVVLKEKEEKESQMKAKKIIDKNRYKRALSSIHKGNYIMLLFYIK